MQPIFAENTGGQGATFEPLKAGVYIARCVKMIHIGTTTEDFQGKPVQANKVLIMWELPTEMKEYKPGDGMKPAFVSKEFTLSMNSKGNLRKFLEGWRGIAYSEEEAKKVDISRLLGVPCQVNIIEKVSSSGKKRNEITSVTMPMKGYPVPAQITPSFSFGYNPFDVNLLAEIPNWVRDKMEKTPEWMKATAGISIPPKPSANPHVDTPPPANNGNQGFVVDAGKAVAESDALPF